MASDVPDPRDLNSEDKNLMIFGNLLLERQNKCKCYYISGRHSNVDCFYLTKGFHESENVVNILSINNILVNINIISGSYANGTTKNTIYSFFPKVSPRYKIIESPVNLVYLPITLDTIDSSEVSITDQDDHLLNLRNEKLTIRFHIRKAR